MMQVIVYRFSQLAADTAHLHQVIDAGTDHALQATELP
jgi:hypothetical protein